jgi:hypothetical protein
VSPRVAKGADGAGFCNVCVHSLAVIIAVSHEDILGIGLLLGKNSMVSVIHAWPVLEQYTL